MSRPMVIKRTKWGRTKMVRSTGDSRRKALNRKNRRRQASLDRIRQATADRRSGKAQKRRERAFEKYDRSAMVVARKASADLFIRQRAEPNTKPISGRQRRQQEAEAARQQAESQRRAKAERERRELEESRRGWFNRYSW